MLGQCSEPFWLRDVSNCDCRDVKRHEEVVSAKAPRKMWDFADWRLPWLGNSSLKYRYNHQQFTQRGRWKRSQRSRYRLKPKVSASVDGTGGRLPARAFLGVPIRCLSLTAGAHTGVEARQARTDLWMELPIMSEDGVFVWSFFSLCVLGSKMFAKKHIANIYYIEIYRDLPDFLVPLTKPK